jgi:hypothetical protein
VKLKQTLKNAWNKFISKKQSELDLEGTEEDNFHAALGADPSDLRPGLIRMRRTSDAKLSPK